MPFESSWMLEKRVLYLHSYGTVAGAQIEAGVNTHLRLLAEGDAPVHVIIDIHKTTVTPHSLTQLRGNYQFKIHPNTGWTVLINSTNKIIVFIVSMMMQINGVREYKTAYTVEDAVKFLNHNDKTLNLDAIQAAAYIQSRNRES